MPNTGTDLPDRAEPEQISAQGCAMAHREVAEAAGGGELGISSAGSGNGGSRLQGDQGLRHEEAEYGHKIYCDATNYGPL